MRLKIRPRELANYQARLLNPATYNFSILAADFAIDFWTTPHYRNYDNEAVSLIKTPNSDFRYVIFAVFR